MNQIIKKHNKVFLILKVKSKKRKQIKNFVFVVNHLHMMMSQEIINKKRLKKRMKKRMKYMY